MRRLFTPPWIVLHCAAVVLTVGFGALGWWQLGRAQHGNAISWGYAFEWPVFALFTAALWVRQVRLELRKDDTRGRRGKPEPPPVASPYEDGILKSRDSIPGSST